MRAVVATSNQGKVAEIQAIFQGRCPWTWIPQEALGVVSPEEPFCTFVENALHKARYASRLTGLPALADDSGLVVPALGGQPGVWSARYGGPQLNWTERVWRLLEAMQQVPPGQRQASFYTLMVFIRYPDDPLPVLCQGQWHGLLAESPQGLCGFGYDPIFFVPTHGCTAAELPSEEKNRISHRRMAMEALVAQL